MMSRRLISCYYFSRSLAQPANRITATSSTFFHIQSSLVELKTAAQGGDNSWARHSLQICPSSVRSYTNEPPKAWDDIKNLPRYDPDKGELVYVGTLTAMVKGVKAFSVSTSIVGLCLQPYILLHTQGHAVVTILAAGSIMGFFIFVTPLVIHFITKKYVTDLYYNAKTDSFTATTYNFFVQRKKLQFTPDDVKVPEVPGMFTTIIAKGKALFMEPNLFSSKQAYVKLMGYDKPLDWELPVTETKNEVKRS